MCRGWRQRAAQADAASCDKVCRSRHRAPRCWMQAPTRPLAGRRRQTRSRNKTESRVPGSHLLCMHPRRLHTPPSTPPCAPCAATTHDSCTDTEVHPRLRQVMLTRSASLPHLFGRFRSCLQRCQPDLLPRPLQVPHPGLASCCVALAFSSLPPYIVVYFKLVNFKIKGVMR